MRVVTLAAVAALSALAVTQVAAQGSDKQAIERYQKMLADSSPAELYEVAGEDLWKKKAGPKGASFERCDLGLGPGVVKGAYAKLPRYFKDADRVMDLETRLVHCMVTLQGRTYAEATQRVYGNADKASELENLVAYVVGQSRGVRIAASNTHPKEIEAYELGKKLFFFRAGAWDFSCASCHGEKDKRIRMQDLPVLSEAPGARRAYSTWPAYRVSSSEMKTMQWRLWDCFRQMRFPEPVFGSEATVALTHYMAVTAKGEPYAGPGTKR